MVGLGSCHQEPSKNVPKTLGKGKKRLVVALAGNANVGKSVLFNQLTGSNQIIGNWPGKTVERAMGALCFEDYEITIVDLPGIYSFSTFSLEEAISREYISFEKPDVVVNVIDAAILERNLFFTLQLMEMQVPLVVCLNQMDAAKKRGIVPNQKKLSEQLGVPVVPTCAIRGEGIVELVKTIVRTAERKCGACKKPILYGKEVEQRIQRLAGLIHAEKLEKEYAARWLAIKLIERDPEMEKHVAESSAKVVKEAQKLSDEVSRIHGEASFAVIASERYSLASKIAASSQQRFESSDSFARRLDWVATHRVLGYFFSAAVLAGLLLWTFTVGDFFAGLLSDAFGVLAPVDPRLGGDLIGILLNGAFGGFVAGVTLVLPFVIPFYSVLAMIEDSGILTRVAFMMDSAMHKIGLHGKALIPLILGYGCNVPAIYACRIMESPRERLLAAFAITFAPCAARTIIILGLVATFVNIEWALALYAIDLAIIFALGRIALRVVPGKTTGLIMEMHHFKVPSLKVVAKQTWVRTKGLMYIVFPIYIVGSAAVQAAYATGLLNPVNAALSPITMGLLGLPVTAGLALILGTVRKEFILFTLIAIYGTNVAAFLTPVQIIVIALVGMVYIPCIATIVMLKKEFGSKPAAIITAANIAAALVFGAIAAHLLPFLF